MASFEQIIKFENEKPNGVVRLVEANGFYRAYNHSAYLFHQAIVRHKVTRKFVKNINQQLVYIGFPVDRLLERIGTRSHKKTEYGYDVELAVDELPNDEGYDEWRETVPTEAASREDANSLPICGRLKSLDWSERPKRIQARVNSMLGVLSHYNCWHVRKVLAWEGRLREFGEVTDDCLRFYPDVLKIMVGARVPRDRGGHWAPSIPV